MHALASGLKELRVIVGMANDVSHTMLALLLCGKRDRVTKYESLICYGAAMLLVGAIEDGV